MELESTANVVEIHYPLENALIHPIRPLVGLVVVILKKKTQLDSRIKKN